MQKTIYVEQHYNPRFDPERGRQRQEEMNDQYIYCVVKTKNIIMKIGQSVSHDQIQSWINNDIVVEITNPKKR